MDEVHYLQDRVRGAVWEEVLINLPVEVRVASLSATVSNAEEFGEWLEATRGATEVVIEERRPVPLDNYYLIGRELHPLFVTRGDDVVPEPGPGPPGRARVAPGPRHQGPHGRNGPRAVGRGWVPSRVEVVDLLEAERLLPAIYFIFSRAGCDQALEQCRAGNIRLTSTAERAEILEFLELKVAPIDPADLDALGYDLLAESLGRGVASHHAGMLPLFKEAVEELFAQGLVKVVFATETLSLGINMPGPAPWPSSGSPSGRASATSCSPRASTPSSPGGPAGAASTAAGPRSCSTSRSSPSSASPGSPRPAPTR
jgi:ATP-dependent RNA helicase HelY